MQVVISQQALTLSKIADYADTYIIHDPGLCADCDTLRHIRELALSALHIRSVDYARIKFLRDIEFQISNLTSLFPGPTSTNQD